MGRVFFNDSADVDDNPYVGDAFALALVAYKFVAYKFVGLDLPAGTLEDEEPDDPAGEPMEPAEPDDLAGEPAGPAGPAPPPPPPPPRYGARRCVTSSR